MNQDTRATWSRDTIGTLIGTMPVKTGDPSREPRRNRQTYISEVRLHILQCGARSSGTSGQENAALELSSTQQT